MANGSLTRDEIARIFNSNTPNNNVGLTRDEIASIYNGPLAVDTPSQSNQTQEIPVLKPIKAEEKAVDMDKAASNNTIDVKTLTNENKRRTDAKDIGRSALKKAKNDLFRQKVEDNREQINERMNTLERKNPAEDFAKLEAEKKVKDLSNKNIVAKDETGLTENAKVEIADLERRRDKLLNYGGIQNERRAQKLQEQIDDLQQKGIASNEDYLVSRDRYDQLMQNSDMTDDIDNLTDIIYNPRRAGGKASADAISEKLTEMDSESYINSLVEKYGLSREELEDMALTRQSDRRNDISEDLGEKAAEFGKEHKKLGTALSLAESIGNGVEGAYNTIAGLVSDDNRRFSKGFNTTKTGLREGVKENYKTNLGKGAYDVLAGLGDLGVGMLTGNAPLMLAGNTANQALLGADEKGQSARKAATYGALSGAADYYFNKVGLDKAKEMAFEGIKSVGAKELLARLGVSAGVEAGENVLQDITQSFLDEVINGNRSDLRTAYEARVADGMDENKAFAETAGDYAKQLLQSGATGALMGAGMFGAHSLGNAVKGGMLQGALKDNSQNVWDKVRASKQNDIPKPEGYDPYELAKQNEINADEVKAQEEQIAQNVEDLSNQIPETPSEMDAAHQMAERYASTYSLFDDYGYYDDADTADGFVEQMADDISNGKDLTQYIDSLRENIDEADPQAKPVMEQLLAELEEMNQGRVPETSENLNPGSTNGTGEPIDTTGRVEPTITPEDVNAKSPTNLENTDNPNNIPPDGITPDNVNPPDMGRRRSITNTLNKAGIVTDYDMENDEAVKDALNYEIRHWDEVSDEAKERLDNNADMWKEQYASGTREIRQDTDLDTGMMILNDPTTSKWTFNSIMRNLVEHGTEAGQFISAFRKWANTATGALAKATQIDTQTVKKWVNSNKKLKDRNNRVAKAISLIGKPEGYAERVPQTHDELKAEIIKTVNEAFGEKAKEFTDDDFEYLTILAETKKVPVRTITKELESKLDTGKWFTIDESLPKKAEKALKNGQISNMLDKIINGEQPKAQKEPEAYGRFLKKIENSLNDKALGLEGEFDGLDVYYLGKLIQERVPKATIENELRHRLETGEWYTIDESIEGTRPVNQRLRNAFKQLRGEDTEIVKPDKPYDQIRSEVVNTLEKEGVLADYSDSDIDYVAHLIEQGMPTKEIASALDMKSATGRFGITEETQQKVNELFEYARHYNEDSREFVEAQAEAYRLLAEEVAPKASPLEKFDTWRYMAMLGNPKTMLRNFVGNKLFGAVTGMSNNLAAAMEKGVDAAHYKRTGEHIQRTKEFLNLKKDRPLINAAKRFAENTAWRQVNGSKYEKMDQESLKRNRSAFDSDVMRMAEKAVDAGISDTKAVISKFATSLAGYMKANGLDESAFDDYYMFDELNRRSKMQVLEPEEMVAMERLRKTATEMEKAKEYALKSAEYATFHEDNEVAKLLTKWSTEGRNSDSIGGKALGYALEGAVPFKKTPANILRSGFEYSPFGALKSIKETGKLIMENTGKNKGNLADEYTHHNKFTGKDKTVQKTLAADVIDSWSKTLTGSALAAMGFYLFDKGVLTSSKEGEKYQDQLEGKGNYAININGHTFTLDWAAPGVMPLLVGAEISKVMESNGRLKEEWYKNPDKWLETVNALLDPMLETSMMSGVKDTLTNAANEVRFNEDNALGGILGSLAGNTLTGYLTQGIPTLSGQIARVVDPVRRTTDTVNEGVLGTIEKQARKVANKIPFLSKINTEYRDAYGRGQYNSPFEYEEGETGKNALKAVGNLAYQMGLPSYYSKVNETDADKMARYVYNSEDSEGLPILDEKVFADWRSAKKINGEKLNPQQMQRFREKMGETNYALRDGLANAEWFQNADTETQAEILKSLNTISDKVGQFAVKPKDVTMNSKLEAYLNAGGGEKGIQAVIDELEAEYNPYGLSKDTYNAMKADGENLEAYRGYGQALEEFGLNDNKTNREAWKVGGQQSLKEINDYGTAFINAGMDKAYTSESAKDAYNSGKLEQYKDYREALKVANKNDSPKLWEEYQKSGSVGGITEEVVKLDDSLKSWSDFGVPDNVYTTQTYERATKEFPGLTQRHFANTFNAINTNGDKGNTSITQDEIIAYLNKNDIDKAEGVKIWNAYLSNPTDKTIPVLEDGTWKKKKK